jgi:hypothetical protein
VGAAAEAFAEGLLFEQAVMKRVNAHMVMHVDQGVL